jgi:hypothetical protein
MQATLRSSSNELRRVMKMPGMCPGALLAGFLCGSGCSSGMEASMDRDRRWVELVSDVDAGRRPALGLSDPPFRTADVEYSSLERLVIAVNSSDPPEIRLYSPRIAQSSITLFQPPAMHLARTLRCAGRGAHCDAGDRA